MTTAIDGADITIRVDTARVAFVLDIHHLDYELSVLTPELDVLADVTCDVLSAIWTWGASDWAGPFTIAEAGTCQLVLRDPERQFDPANDAITPPIPGRLLQILVDGAPAFTGHVSDISHSLARGESIVQGRDAIALLSGIAFPSLNPEGSTVDQFTWCLGAIDWPPAERVTYGTPAAWRELGPGEETAWPSLLRISRAELGTVWADRSNRVAFRCRGIDEPVVSVLPVIGCEGADVEDVSSLLERRAVVNHVLVESDDEGHIALAWPDTESIGIFGKRSTRVSRDDLRLGFPPP